MSACICIRSGPWLNEVTVLTTNRIGKVHSSGSSGSLQLVTYWKTPYKASKLIHSLIHSLVSMYLFANTMHIFWPLDTCTAPRMALVWVWRVATTNAAQMYHAVDVFWVEILFIFNSTHRIYYLKTCTLVLSPFHWMTQGTRLLCVCTTPVLLKFPIPWRLHIWIFNWIFAVNSQHFILYALHEHLITSVRFRSLYSRQCIECVYAWAQHLSWGFNVHAWISHVIEMGKESNKI